MSKKFELPPMVGVDKDPSRSPRTGRVLSRAEREMAETLERERRPTTHGFSGKTGAVAAAISGRAEREVDPDYLRRLQQPGHVERGRSPLRASGLISSTLARSFQNYLDYYSKSKEKDEALRHKIDDYLRAMEEEQRAQQQRHREHGPGQAPERPERPKSPKSPRSKYPAPTSKRAAFELLGIAPSSTEAEINKAYRKMALKLHPDKNLHNLIEAEEQFKQLQAAIDMIKNPGQMGGKNRSHRVYRRRNTRHTKRSNKSSKSSKRHYKTHRR